MIEKKKIIVFDFDKTLTYRDSLFGFYLKVGITDKLRYLRLFFYFISMVAFKIKLLSNTSVKKLGFFLFLKGKNIDFIEKQSNSYSKEICFNNLFESFKFSDRNQRVIIVSASYEVYLKFIFDTNVEVFGSSYEVKNKVLKKFLFNCYGDNKRKIINDQGIEIIDVLYTDSLSDRALALISRSINIVRNDRIVRCNNVREFDEFFRQ